MHDHTAGHTHGADSREEAEAKLLFMLNHNEHHVAELRDLAHALEHFGCAGKTGLITEAIACYESGNALLKNAIEAMGD